MEMNKPKIYIAGKVTGEDRLECAAKFAKAKQEIEAAGFEAVNPLEVVGTWDITWKDAMKKCIKALVDCDLLFILSDAYLSKGALTEMQLAHRLAIRPIFNLKELKEWSSTQPTP